MNLRCLFLLAAALSFAASVAGAEPDCFPITSSASIVHMGSLDSFDITEGGKKAARELIKAVEAGDTNAARQARQIYQQIIPNENFGGEYTALQWFCDYLLAGPQQQQTMRADPLVDNFYQFFATNNFYALRRYVNRKYHLLDKQEEKGLDMLEERFLEDFILFNNPRREGWEKTSKIIKAVNLKPGQVVADIGCGPGYYSFQFAKRVGPKGKVYALDTNERHVKYVNELRARLGVTNVVAIQSEENDTGLSEPVDTVFMCSLYHVVYTALRLETRENLVRNIKKILKPDGTLVLVDNALVRDSVLPYHGPFIAKELIIAQLKYYGFRHVATHQFTPQRYTLVFKHAESPIPAERRFSPEEATSQADCIQINSRHSLVSLADSAPSSLGKTAAQMLWAGLEKQDTQAVKQARSLYDILIPREKFGGDYTALQWFCDHWLTPEKDRDARLTNVVAADYCRFFTATNWSNLKEYLQRQYHLAEFPDQDTKFGRERITFLADFILFNNPRREEWEQTSRYLTALALKPGETVGDVGCGPGYYSLMFAQQVGPNGRVYAMDINQDHTDYLTGYVRQNDINNVLVIRSQMNNISLGGPVDTIFMGSLFPIVYATNLEPVKDEFFGSIRSALKPGGRLVILDNDVVEPPALPYHGPAIDRRLVISQLKHYGFKLVTMHQFIPQRYMLVFEKSQDK